MPFLPKAIIFDMDGVIVDSQQQWHKHENFIFSNLLPQIPTHKIEKITQEVTGRSVHDEYDLLVQKYNMQKSFDEFMAIYDAKAQQVYKTETNLSAHLLDFLKNNGTKYTFALASSSSEQWIKLVLDRFSLNTYFNEVVSAEHIQAPSKPDPAIFLHTAEKLNLRPAQCLVIEDSQAGVRAAKTAGMACIGFLGHQNKQDLSLADTTIDSFDQLEGRLATFDTSKFDS